jgi:pimeloyl-ACP methyl ester carboxylesterase
MNETEKTLCVTGLRHRLLEWPGPSELPPIVLVHGWMDSAASFRAVALALQARGRRVLAPDLRGYGDTEHIHEQATYYFADYVRDLHELLAAEGHGSIDLVGHSMGGSVAVTFAGAFPARVRRLVLVEGLGPNETSPAEAPERTRRWIETARAERRVPRAMTWEQVIETLTRNHPRVPGDVLARVAPGFVRRGADDLYRWKADARHREPWAIPFNRATFLAHLAAIEAPTLFIDGGPRGWHPEDEASRLAAIRNLERATIADAGHMMHWTHASEFAALVGEFFEREPAGPQR